MDELEQLRAKVVELEAHNDEYCRAYVEEHQDTVKELLAIKTTQAERLVLQAEQIKLARDALEFLIAYDTGAAIAQAEQALATLDSAEYEPVSTQDKVDAERYRWLVDNSYDREGHTQLHVWKHTWEPHSATGEPTEWKCRIRGSAIDAAIDKAREGK